MYCFDTNILVEYLRGNVQIKEKLEKIVKDEMNMSITVITLCELYKGVFLAQKQEKELEKVNHFIEVFTLLGITNEAAMLFGELFAQLQKQGESTQEGDLLIASIAMEHRQVLVTRNKKHFKNIPDLQLEVW